MASNGEISRNDVNEPPEWAERRKQRAIQQAEQRDWIKKPRMRQVREAVRERLARENEPERLCDVAFEIATGKDPRAAVVALNIIVKLDEPDEFDDVGVGSKGGVLEIKRHFVDGEEVFTREEESNGRLGE